MFTYAQGISPGVNGAQGISPVVNGSRWNFSVNKKRLQNNAMNTVSYVRLKYSSVTIADFSGRNYQVECL